MADFADELTRLQQMLPEQVARFEGGKKDLQELLNETEVERLQRLLKDLIKVIPNRGKTIESSAYLEARQYLHERRLI